MASLGPGTWVMSISGPLAGALWLERGGAFVAAGSKECHSRGGGRAGRGQECVRGDGDGWGAAVQRCSWSFAAARFGADRGHGGVK